MPDGDVLDGNAMAVDAWLAAADAGRLGNTLVESLRRHRGRAIMRREASGLYNRPPFEGLRQHIPLLANTFVSRATHGLLANTAVRLRPFMPALIRWLIRAARGEVRGKSRRLEGVNRESSAATGAN